MTSSTERGDTLVELLIAMAILGLSIVILLGGFANLSLVSGRQRDSGRALTALASASEYVKGNCHTTASCTSASLSSIGRANDVVLTLTPGGTATFATTPLLQWTVSSTAGSAAQTTRFTEVVVVRP